MNNKNNLYTKKRIIKINKISKILIIIAITIASIVLIFSIYKIVNWFIDNKNTNTLIDNISDNTDIKEITDNENTELVNPPEDKFDPYWDYIKIPLIDVDFNELLKENKNTVGWLFVNNTNINYPVVQGKNNSYYLNVSFNDKYSDAGWIFMDYRNDKNLADKNTVIYGHSRKNMSLFGTLRNVVKKSWYKDGENYIVKFSTPKENTLWQVFSTYTIEEETYYITTSFASDKDFEAWTKTMLKRSVFNYKTTINKEDKVLTLSSCYTSDGIRVVLHAKLIKKEVR